MTDCARKVSLVEVESHCTEGDVWLIFEGRVYNLSGYLSKHPGGQALLRFAGKDATQAVLEQSAHKSVPNFIRRILSENLVGVLDIS